jgi:hypothetical protein
VVQVVREELLRDDCVGRVGVGVHRDTIVVRVAVSKYRRRCKQVQMLDWH